MESVAITYGGARERKRERAWEPRRERRDPRQPPPLLSLETLLPPPGNALLGRVLKFGLCSFGFRELLSSLHVYFSRPPPLLVILNCCTVVAAVLVTGCGMGDHRNHHRSYRYFSSAVRPCLAEFYGCCIQHQGATSSPELLLLRFLDYSIELRLCLEAVAAAGMVGIDAVAVG
ncbi:uncharacterized protein DS421_4g118460 [Arachis hypogaea]|nr:uncharacterized protein DS421_4g118460 [Arachis hypogaea]